MTDKGRGQKRDGVRSGVSSIEDWRRKIDAIDDRLLALLNERANCSIQIGWIKRAQDMEIYVPSREVQILKRVSNANHGPLTEEAIRRLFERIIDESRSIERVVCSRASKKEASSARARHGRRQRKNRSRGKTETRGGSGK